MPKIGIFWVYRNKVIGKAIELSEGEKNIPGVIDSPDTHVDYWENDPSFINPFLELRGVEYHTVPRGRVLFSVKENMAIIYMDKVLFKNEIKMLVKDFFDIGESKVVWRRDIHYSTTPLDIDNLFED